MKKVVINRILSLALLAILLYQPVVLAKETEPGNFAFSGQLMPLDMIGLSRSASSGPASPTPTVISDHNMIKDLSGDALNRYTPSGSYSTDLFSGSAAYSYPIQVPPGTNGLQPSISLGYNHHQTALRGVLGNAWSLTQNYIYRDINGTLENTADDAFKLHFNGLDMKLVFAGGYYHTEIENYWKIERVAGGNNFLKEHWILRTKDGKAYRFGYNYDSEFMSNQGIISTDWPEFASIWSLDSIKDTHGNEISYDYDENPSADYYPYLYKISYNRGSNIITFNYDYDSFSGFDGYAYGARIRQNAILNSIVVSSGGNLVRRYGFEYQSISHKKFLNIVRFFGNDNSSELPPMRFSYHMASKGWISDPNYVIPSEAYFGEHKDNGVRVLDINGDGYDDVIKMQNTNNMDYWLNNKYNGWLPKQSLSSLLAGGIVNDWGQDLGVRFFDFDQDSRIDIIKLLKDVSTVKKILINSGNGWKEKGMEISEDIAFIKKNEASERCEPELCPYDYTDEGISCSNGICTRSCSIMACNGMGTAVLDESTNDPGWSDDSYEDWDDGRGFTPQSNKCYKFEFTGSKQTDGDDSDCYDLYTDDRYVDGDYDADCNGRDIDAYAGVGFAGKGTSSTWLSTIFDAGDNYGYAGDATNPAWNYFYISKYDNDDKPDDEGSNKGDWDGFDYTLCDEGGTHTIYCTPSYGACRSWGVQRCGYGCAAETTYPYVVIGLYAGYNNNLWDALLDNYGCTENMIGSNSYYGKNNNYKVTEYDTSKFYKYYQCNYAVDEYVDTGIRLADLNTDGRLDIIRSTEAEKSIWLNTGAEFIPINSTKVPSEAVFADIGIKKDGGTRIVDLNADGLPDLVKGKDGKRITWINNGREWMKDDTWLIPADAVFIENGSDKGVLIIDVDGDGLVDILRADPSVRKAWINTGRGWEEDPSWSIPSSLNFIGPSLTIADVNADGLPDLLMASSSENKASWTNAASKGHLLDEIINMFGGITRISYEKMASLDNTGEDDVSDLPFGGWVVASITKDNGLSGSHKIISTTNYHYSGGLFDAGEKEFRGFNTVDEILPDGAAIRHVFNQDKGKKGLESKRLFFGFDSNLYQKIEYNWFYEHTQGYYEVYLKDITDYTYR